MRSFWSAISFIMLSLSIGSLAWVGQNYLDALKNSKGNMANVETRIGNMEGKIYAIATYVTWLDGEIHAGRLRMLSTKELGSKIPDMAKIKRDLQKRLNESQAVRAEFLKVMQESESKAKGGVGPPGLSSGPSKPQP